MRSSHVLIFLLILVALPLLSACASTPSAPTLQSQRLAHYVARVAVYCPREGEAHMGSGVVIASNGLVLTAYHVTRAAETAKDCTIKVGIASRINRPVPLNYTAILVDRDPVMDLALVRIVADRAGRPLETALPYASLAPRTPKTGETIHVLGFPQITDDVLAYDSDTVISEGDCSSADTCWLLTEAFASWGSSGGPVFDDAGQLVGITLGQRTVAFGDTQHRLTSVRPLHAIRPFLRRAMRSPAALTDTVTPSPQVPRMDQWQVKVVGPLGVNWRTEPSTRGGRKTVRAVLDKGFILHVIPPGKWEGWWATADSRGRMGWVKERTDSTQLVEAFLVSVTSRITPQTRAVITCLTQAPCAHLRYTPGYQSEEGNVVGSLAGGTQVEILEGPYEVKGLVWWHVRGGEKEGWLPEVTERGYRLLTPLPALETSP